jgi:deoxyribonucleoside regulator
MNDQENLTSRLVEVARLYYLEEKSQQEIADILQVSRSLIALYLKKAKDQGIVKFLIVNPEDQFQDLSNIITEKMGLRHVKIVPTENKSHEFTRNLLADYAASYLDSIISDGDIIGLDWGRSVQAVVSKLNPVRPRKLLFIPLLGEAGSHNMVTRINQTVLEAARAYKSEATFLHAPVISDTKFVRDALLQNTASRNTIENWPKITIACTGIGAFPPQEGQFVIIEDEIEKELVKKNIVGNICTYYFDQIGRAHV